jgi:hypothetical protein
MTMQEALPTKEAAAGYSPSPQQEEAVMHLGVVHTIRDRAAWDSVVNVENLEFPPGFELLSSVTQDDVSRTICIWDAPSVDALQRMLDELLGAASVNDCFVADPARSINLPAPKTAPASA